MGSNTSVTVLIASSPDKMPFSTIGTNVGHANDVICKSVLILFNALGYAALLIVPSVPMTAILLFFVDLIAARAPGRMTPITGMSKVLFNESKANAVAVLQATTIILICFESK